MKKYLILVVIIFFGYITIIAVRIYQIDHLPPFVGKAGKTVYINEYTENFLQELDKKRIIDEVQKLNNNK